MEGITQYSSLCVAREIDKIMTHPAVSEALRAHALKVYEAVTGSSYPPAAVDKERIQAMVAGRIEQMDYLAAHT